MADNTELNPASGGDIVSTDSLGGSPEVKVQRVKIQTGTDGNATDVNASNPLPVSDNGAALTVDDGGSSLTVDSPQLPAALVGGRLDVNVGAALPAGTNNIGDVDVLSLPSLPAGANTIGAVAITDGTDLADVTAANALKVDGSAVTQPVSDAGGSLTVDVGTALPAGDNNIGNVDVVTLPSIPAGTNNIGDVDVLSVPSPLSTAGNGTAATAHRVTLASDSPGVVTEDAAALADPVGMQAMVRVRSAPAVEVSTSGDHAALSGPVEGGVWTALIGDGIPAERIGGTTANGLDVDVTRVVPGTGATSLGKAEDAAHSSGDTGVLALAVRRDTAASSSGTDGDYSTLNVDASGRLHANALVQGQAAHDAAVSGSPVLVGLEARGANHGTPVGEGDAARAIADPMGKQVVLIGAPHGQGGSGRVTLTNTTASDVLAATSDGVSRWVVTNIIVTNADGSVGTKVEIRNGTTVVMQPYATADGGGFALSNPHGIFRGSADTAITARCVTTDADVDVFISGYKERT